MFSHIDNTIYLVLILRHPSVYISSIYWEGVDNAVLAMYRYRTGSDIQWYI